MGPNNSSSGKDPGLLIEEADGHPIWLREALEQIFQRLPPLPPPPAPPKTGLQWDPRQLAIFQIDPGCVPLSTKNRWYLSAWLKKLSQELTDGILPEGDSHEGFRSIYTLGKDGGS